MAFDFSTVYVRDVNQRMVRKALVELMGESERVLTNDPGIGVVRHVDAGYQEAIAFADEKGIKIPMK